MEEVAVTGKHHRGAALVGGGNDLLVADRPAGLDRGSGTGGESGDQAVGKREHRVTGDHGIVQVTAELLIGGDCLARATSSLS